VIFQAYELRVLSDWDRLSQAARFLPSAIGGFSFPQVTRFSSRPAHRPPHDGVRRAKRPNLFHGLAGLRPRTQDSKRDRLAHRPHGNGAFRSRGFKFQLVHSPFYAIAPINFGTPAGGGLFTPEPERGAAGPHLQPPISDIDAYWTPHERTEVSRMLTYALVGGPDAAGGTSNSSSRSRRWMKSWSPPRFSIMPLAFAAMRSYRKCITHPLCEKQQFKEGRWTDNRVPCFTPRRPGSFQRY